MSIETQKKVAAEAALEYIQIGDVIGVGTGSTANYFIDALAAIKGKLDGTVASSEATAARLRGHGIPVKSLDDISLQSTSPTLTGFEFDHQWMVLPCTIFMIASYFILTYRRHLIYN